MTNRIDNLTAALSPAANASDAGSTTGVQRGPAFEAVLAGKRVIGGEDIQSRRAEAREAANGMISVTFLTPMMKMMRDDPFKSEMFHGGRGEEIFGAQLDEVLADRVAQSLRLPLADAVYRRILGEAGEPRSAVNTHG